jgi:hypothetical protein
MRFVVRHRVQAVNWLLVAFYVAAAGRGLVPGMCATLLNSAADGEFATEVQASCCSAEMCAAPSDTEAPAYRHHVEPHPPCAFCHLALARVFAAEAFVIPDPGDALAAPAPHPAASPLLPHVADTNVGRDPPVVSA